MVFEPSLVPVLPNNPSVEVVYHTPVSSQWTTQNITAIVDTPYNVIDVSFYTILYSYLVFGPAILLSLSDSHCFDSSQPSVLLD